MTSKLDPQELERLAQVARRRHSIELANTPYGVMEFGQIARALTAIADKLRTGQLVPAMPSDPWAGQAELLDECQKAASELDRQALTNIRTLTDAQPSGDVVEAVAKQICRNDPDVRMGDANGVVEQRVAYLWKDYVNDARAAITTYEAVSGVAKMQDASKTFAQMMEGWGPEYFPARIVTDYESTASAYDIRWEDIEALRAALGEKP